MNPDIDADGLVRWRDGDGTERRWASLAELAADWWRYQRQSESEKDADPMIAWECVLEFGGSGDPPHPRRH